MKVTFHTSNALFQHVYDAAEAKCRLNLQDFAGRRVLIEGAGYHKIWLETQPMSGEAYAGRDLTAALNNNLLFMEHQRADGRIPGSIEHKDGGLEAQFNKFQGFCFPRPALELAAWIGYDREYLLLLYDCLRRFDEYLWRVRDSNNDGCLEAWCVTDTGEDGALRYGDAPFWWTGDTPPAGYAVVPIQSMDVTAYSVTARDTISAVSNLLGRDENEIDAWRKKADDVRKRIRSYLWDDNRGACFDRDKDGYVMPALLHNNLRLMYWNAMSHDMADRFVTEHLTNPEEFWTPMPLPSVAANDILFRNNHGNDWSGQPQGLTYLRSIRALENYDYYDLIPKLAEKLVSAIGSNCVFTQQFDTFTGKIASDKDGYGPTMLAVLSFAERLHGVRRELDTLRFSALGGGECEYALTIGDMNASVCGGDDKYECVLNGKKIAIISAGEILTVDMGGEIIARNHYAN
ncbi:hypothetical protein FACS18948_1510 [Clostridia bacterium]|nr:hypothetical protein FACS18948_1510 [Clostridia bacterium]